MIRNATKRIFMEIGHRKGYLAVGIAISLALFLLSCHYLFEGFNKRFFLYTALSLMTGGLWVCPRIKQRLPAALLVLLYVIFAPVKLFQRIELPVQDMSGMLRGAGFANYLIILLIYALFLLLFHRINFAFLGGNLLLFAAMLLNVYSNQQNGNALSWSDVKNIGAFLSPGGNGLYMTGELWYSILYFAFFISLGFWCDIPVSRKGKGYHIAVTSFSLVLALSLFGFLNWSDYTARHGLQGYHGNSRYDETLDGFLLGFGLGVKELSEDKEWYEKYGVVCHALGTARECDVEANYLEGLEYSYELGLRVFEADIQITSDQEAVLRHDWEQDLGQAESFGWTEDDKPVPTTDLFMETPIFGEYTPLRLLDLYEIMEQKDDIYVVLDPKYTTDVETQFQLIVDTAVDNGYEAVLDRVIVQLYYEEMYDMVEQVYPFKNYIYTLYYIGWAGGDAVGSFCREKHIPVLVMPYTWVSHSVMEELAPYPELKIYTHTVNTAQDAQYMLSLTVDGIYSSSITPSDIIRWKNN